jgi:hypothetical protein
MKELILELRLRPVVRRLRLAAGARRLAAGFAGAAGVAAGFACEGALWGRGISRGGLAAWMAAGGLAVYFLWRPRSPGVLDAARCVERAHPDLDGALVTAVEQRADPRGGLNFLQHRLLARVLEHWNATGWRGAVSTADMARSFAPLAFAFAACMIGLQAVRVSPRYPGDPAHAARLASGAVEVTPGDVALEKGSSLVVLARFGGAPPPGADLVVTGAHDGDRRISLTRSLSDPVLGGSAPNIVDPVSYRVEYAGVRTREFRVTVFEHPRLERADATVTYPAYTGQAAKRIDDTRRLTAVEGSVLDLAFQFNKPVAVASLVPRKKGGATLKLAISTNRPSASLDRYVLNTGDTYDLRLTDAEGRTNKVPAVFILDAVPNRTPEIQIASPKGDTRPTAVEEMIFSGTVWDDFGVLAYGVTVTEAGAAPREIRLGGDVKAREKRPFEHILRLEDLHLSAGRLLSWNVWADDIGPDGAVRRTTSDLFFAEVRPFDEIFKEGQSQSGENEQNDEEGQNGGQRPTAKLAELQKQIISATWNLSKNARIPAGGQYKTNAAVILDSQQQALAQAGGQEEQAADPRTKALWTAVTREMKGAADALEKAAGSPDVLPKALGSEQAAYQALLAMASREHQVSRQRNRSQGAGQGRQASQRQTDQLDLKQSDRRYETQRQAKAQQKPAQREQLQTMNRLQELARRQQDLNEKLKELQTALQEARTPAEQEERRRELKRLEEEQRQMLADADELRQAMDRAENQTAMSDERRQLDDARDQLQKAADAAAQGSPGQALAAGARAQQQLQKAREDLRKRNSSQFEDTMREMRAEARDLERRQKELSEKMDGVVSPGRRSLAEAETPKEWAGEAEAAREEAAKLVQKAIDVSQQAETAEPLVSERLYDTLRKWNQDDAAAPNRLQEQLARRGLLNRKVQQALAGAGEGREAKALDAAKTLLEQGMGPQAAEAGRQAAEQVKSLRTGIERAAEGVLGDDTESLRQAARDLDAAASQLQKEAAVAAAGAETTGATNQASAVGGRQDGPRGRRGAEPSQSGTAESRGGSRDEASARSGDPQDPRSGQAAERGSGARQGGDQPGRQQGERGNRQGAGSDRSQAGGAREVANSARPSQGARSGGGRQGGAFDLSRALGGSEGGSDGGGTGGGGPLLSASYGAWNDNLRDVEQMIDDPALRNQVAAARDRARLMRLEYRRHGVKPDWTTVQLQVVKPLIEARNRLADELARRDSHDALAPVDRDPPPAQFSELVERYFENLGKGR